MKNFKQYFTSHLKESTRSIITILSLVLILTFIFAMNSHVTSMYDYETGKETYSYHSSLYIPVLFMCILCYVIPVLEFSFFKKRINLDCAYALPISRKDMGLVHYLTGLILLFVAFTLSYLLNFFLLLGRGAEHFALVNVIPHFFLSLLLGFSMYSVMVFVFNEANSTSDGIWFMLLYSFVFILVIEAAVSIFSDEIAATYGFVTWGTIDSMTTSYQYLTDMETYEMVLFWDRAEYVISFIFWIVLGIAAFVGFFFTFGKRRMEKCEEISDSFFGFRVLIPVYAVSGMIVFPASISIVFWFIIEILAVLGYTIYRRGFRYKKSDLIIIASLLALLLV